MSIFLVIINLIIFLLALLSLWVMAKKHVKFPKRVFFALGLGIVLASYSTLFMVLKAQSHLKQRIGSA
ncbi:L-cystine uptake protein TcyP [Staphylococcus pseudintermedius]|nr:L-cystine uptake protein TcyP [Staphylococcus pseudintermedius]